MTRKIKLFFEKTMMVHVKSTSGLFIRRFVTDFYIFVKTVLKIFTEKFAYVKNPF